MGKGGEQVLLKSGVLGVGFSPQSHFSSSFTWLIDLKMSLKYKDTISHGYVVRWQIIYSFTLELPGLIFNVCHYLNHNMSLHKYLVHQALLPSLVLHWIISWEVCNEKTATVSAWGRPGTLRKKVGLYKTPLFLNTVLEGRRRGGQGKIGQMGAEKEVQ